MILRWHDDEDEDEDSITVTAIGMMYEACLVLCSTSTDTPNYRSRRDHRSRMYPNEEGYSSSINVLCPWTSLSVSLSS
jgi:hypothetical protein